MSLSLSHPVCSIQSSAILQYATYRALIWANQLSDQMSPVESSISKIWQFHKTYRRQLQKLISMLLYMVRRWTPSLSTRVISEITTIALYVAGSLHELRSNIWYLYTTRSMWSSLLKSSCLSSALPATNTCTITTLCASTISSISNMLNYLVNCSYKIRCICAHINISKRVHVINW